MNETKRQELIEDFLQWSGGFPPESEHQITVYIDYALQADFHPNQARDALFHWMQDEEVVVANKVSSKASIRLQFRRLRRELRLTRDLLTKNPE